MSYLTWPIRLGAFVAWYTWQVLVSNLRVTADILTADDRSTPLVVRFETNCHSDLEIALLSILISLTPGTLVLAVDEERTGTAVYVHAMYDEREVVLKGLQTLQDRMLHAVRRKEARR